MYNFSDLKQKIEQVTEWLKKEHQGIRTGRATPTILDSVKVEAYDSKMPIDQVATISSEGPKTLRITPWDLELSKSIEKAIQTSNLGLSVSIDDKGIRINFPELSEERRLILKKVSRQKLEEAKVSLKTEREKVWDDIQKKNKLGELSEDDKFRLKDDMQKIIDEAQKKFEEMTERKEQEILER